MKTAITIKLFWASGGMVDTPVLGTGLETGEGSSPFSPTTTVTQWLNVVAHGVAFMKQCCTAKNKMKGNNRFLGCH